MTEKRILAIGGLCEYVGCGLSKLSSNIGLVLPGSFGFGIGEIVASFHLDGSRPAVYEVFMFRRISSCAAGPVCRIIE
ncbi:hypothetical protein E2C01_031394 [Portunus trituberculatus]|uniref:Uncharacterized protein n=1 Tax=Portunus trituberculatus TaxID=210409 RepID=A0A5B7EY03_PORTR|nr:hypothetical protein [Portunus trituberculatus]